MTTSASATPTGDPAVLAELKRTLQPAGLRFAEGRQVEQGELAPVLSGLARRQRRLGQLLLAMAVGMLGMAALNLALGPRDSGLVPEWLEAAQPWLHGAMYLVIAGTQGWLGWRCLRWSAALRETSARCAAGTLDAAGALGAIDTALGGRTPPRL